MTYCLGILTDEGLVMASDSRSNAGHDQVNTCRKMHRFVKEGDRTFVILTSGSLSISQSVITLLRDDFDAGRGLAVAESLYHAARIVGDCVRKVSDLDRAALERDDYNFNVHLLLGGQVKGEMPNLYLIYPQGNPLRATEDSPICSSESANTGGQSSIAASIRQRRCTWRQSTRYFPSTPRCDRT